MVKRFGVIGALAALSIASVAVTFAGEKPSAKVRVGTFKRTELLVAFYRSAAWDKELRNMMAERDAAKARGDMEKVKEIEAKGRKSQEHAHKQLAGQASLDNILAHLKDALPAVAKEAGVEVIVEKPLFATERAQLVDVTALLVKQLPKRVP